MLFEEDVRAYIQNQFDFFGIPSTLSTKIEDDLLKLFTLQIKYINPKPRTVKVSKELLAKIDSLHYSSEVCHLKLLFLNGGNVNPFQNKDLFNPHKHDELVYDWNIFHFHLSTVRKEFRGDPRYEYFNDRTKAILFVYVSDEYVLFLDVRPHSRSNLDVFADPTLIEIIDNNWPDVLLASDDVIGQSFEPTPSQRRKLRKNKINHTYVKVNGKFVHPPGGGIVASGHSSDAAEKLVAFKRWLATISKNSAIVKHIDNYSLVFGYGGPRILNKGDGKTVASLQP